MAGMRIPTLGAFVAGALALLACNSGDDTGDPRTRVASLETQLAQQTPTLVRAATPSPSADDRFCERLNDWRDAAQQTEVVANVITRAEAQGREELRAAFHTASNVVVPSGQTAAQAELASDVLEWARLYEAWLVSLSRMYSATTGAEFARLAAESNQMILTINNHERAMAPKLEAECGIPPIDPYRKPSGTR